MSETSEDYDPFEQFSRAQGAGIIEDPYPDWIQLREQAGVIKADPAEFGAMALLGAGDGGVFLAVSYEAVQQVLRDGQTFSSSGYANTMGQVFGHSILEMDAPEHLQHRSLLQQAFTKRALERWETDLVRPAINRRIDTFIESGRADLVRELTFPFPVEVIAEMIGVPEERHADFHRWAVEVISIQIDIERGLAASANLRELFAEVLEERRREPREDLMSILGSAELDGQRLDDESIFAFCRLLAPAGAETTYRSSSNLLVGLLTHTEQLDALRADPDGLMPGAIDEGLRWECPLTGISRTTTRDSTVCGVSIPKNAGVMVNMGSANHDSTRFEEPRRFDIRRPNAKQHLAFAFGPHRCLGQHLALMETRVLLEQLFARLPNLRLDPEKEPPQITGLMFRSPPSIHVVFDVEK